MYGDRSDKDERFWSAFELYAATGDSEYLKKAETLYSDELRITSYGWAEVSGLGAMCCLFEIGDKPENTLYSVIKERFISECKKIQSLSERATAPLFLQRVTDGEAFFR